MREVDAQKRNHKYRDRQQQMSRERQIEQRFACGFALIKSFCAGGEQRQLVRCASCPVVGGAGKLGGRWWFYRHGLWSWRRLPNRPAITTESLGSGRISNVMNTRRRHSVNRPPLRPSVGRRGEQARRDKVLQSAGMGLQPRPVV